MQINASNIPYLPSITCTYNCGALSITLVYIRNCIDTKRGGSIIMYLSLSLRIYMQESSKYVMKYYHYKLNKVSSMLCQEFEYVFPLTIQT